MMKKHLPEVIRAAIILLICSSTFSYAQKPLSKADSTLSWYKDAKFGMFIHFDVRGDRDTWNPRNLDTDEWVRIAKQAGMKYMAPTTHQSSHIIMWDSEVSTRDLTDLISFTCWSMLFLKPTSHFRAKNTVPVLSAEYVAGRKRTDNKKNHLQK